MLIFVISNGLFFCCLVYVSCYLMILGSLQSRETTLQIFPSTTAFKRSIINQWTQSFSIEKCSNATDGHGTANTTAGNNSQSNAANGKLFMDLNFIENIDINIFWCISDNLLFSCFFRHLAANTESLSWWCSC